MVSIAVGNENVIELDGESGIRQRGIDRSGGETDHVTICGCHEDPALRIG